MSRLTSSCGTSIPVRLLGGLVSLACVVAPTARAAERQVLLVAAADSYADLKRQLAWIGPQIDNPGLAAMVESLLMLSTQGRGLAGLDVKRPLGLVVTSDGTDIAVHGFVPVKDLDKLLTSLQGVIGPAERAGDARRIALPSGLALTITERDGWAVIGQAARDDRPAPAPGDPTPLVAKVAADYTLGVEAYPSRMSAEVRRKLEAALDQAAAASAAQGQPMEPAAVKAVLASLGQTESLALGIGIDDERGKVFVENRSAAIPGSTSAAVSAASATGTLTVGTPAGAADEPPAIRGYIAQSIPETARAEFLEALDQTLPRDADDSLTRTVSRLVRDLLGAALSAGGIDAALTIDTSTATKEKPLPSLTAGVRVNDGAALERQVKQAFGAGAAIPGVKTAFDVGKAGAASLHRVSIDVADDELADRIGDSLDLTLAVAPNYALVLAGGDVAKRAEATLAASGRPAAGVEPIAGLEAAAAPLLDYASAVAAVAPAARGAEAARTAKSGLMDLRVRPIDRGFATRLSIDSGVLKAAAALAAPERPLGPGGVPLPEVPPGFPIPLPR